MSVAGSQYHRPMLDILSMWMPGLHMSPRPLASCTAYNQALHAAVVQCLRLLLPETYLTIDSSADYRICQ